MTCGGQKRPRSSRLDGTRQWRLPSCSVIPIMPISRARLSDGREYHRVFTPSGFGVVSRRSPEAKWRQMASLLSRSRIIYRLGTRQREDADAAILARVYIFGEGGLCEHKILATWGGAHVYRPRSLRDAVWFLQLLWPRICQAKRPRFSHLRPCHLRGNSALHPTLGSSEPTAA